MENKKINTEDKFFDNLATLNNDKNSVYNECYLKNVSRPNARIKIGDIVTTTAEFKKMTGKKCARNGKVTALELMEM
jgi:hypothetical protein